MPIFTRGCPLYLMKMGIPMPIIIHANTYEHQDVHTHVKIGILGLVPMLRDAFDTGCTLHHCPLERVASFVMKRLGSVTRSRK